MPQVARPHRVVIKLTPQQYRAWIRLRHLHTSWEKHGVKSGKTGPKGQLRRCWSEMTGNYSELLERRHRVAGIPLPDLYSTPERVKQPKSIAPLPVQSPTMVDDSGIGRPQSE